MEDKYAIMLLYLYIVAIPMLIVVVGGLFWYVHTLRKLEKEKRQEEYDEYWAMRAPFE